jgi:hypothetical protein
MPDVFFPSLPPLPRRARGVPGRGRSAQRRAPGILGETRAGCPPCGPRPVPPREGIQDSHQEKILSGQRGTPPRPDRPGGHRSTPAARRDGMPYRAGHPHRGVRPAPRPDTVAAGPAPGPRPAVRDHQGKLPGARRDTLRDEDRRGNCQRGKCGVQGPDRGVPRRPGSDALRRQKRREVLPGDAHPLGAGNGEEDTARRPSTRSSAGRDSCFPPSPFRR